VTSRGGIAQVTAGPLDLRARPALLERIFGAIADRGVTLDMMNVSADRAVFTLERGWLDRVRAALADLEVPHDVRADCAKVTLVGGGIHGVPGVMHRMVRALTRAGIAILQSVDSNMIIGVLVEGPREREAVRAIHTEFFESAEAAAPAPAAPPGDAGGEGGKGS
jgi:aspartate kinase